MFSALSWRFGSSSWMCASAVVPTCDWIWNSRRTAKKWWQSIDHCVAEKWGRRALKWMFNSGDKYWASIHIFFLGTAVVTFELSVVSIFEFPQSIEHVFFFYNISHAVPQLLIYLSVSTIRLMPGPWHHCVCTLYQLLDFIGDPIKSISHSHSPNFVQIDN